MEQCSATAGARSDKSHRSLAPTSSLYGPKLPGTGFYDKKYEQILCCIQTHYHYDN